MHTMLRSMLQVADRMILDVRNSRSDVQNPDKYWQKMVVASAIMLLLQRTELNVRVHGASSMSTFVIVERARKRSKLAADALKCLHVHVALLSLQQAAAH